MVGIDHSKASIEYREKFSFTKSNAIVAMKQIKQIDNVSGCTIISTCNRTEIWISYCNKDMISLYDMICDIKQIDRESYSELFTEREGKEAVIHLFELACGMKSRIFGEDQIISQVKEAIINARESHCADSVLENLFRTAITAAKRVKTEIKLVTIDRSTATSTVELLKNMLGDLCGYRIMVIGNGEMGRLAAKEMEKEGADVNVTVRNYKRGEVIIPKGCGIINYHDRMNYLNHSDIIISATASPHYTMKYEEIEAIIDLNQKIFVDLAVPRDIDPKIASLDNVKLFCIDDLDKVYENEQLKQNIDNAEKILNEYLEEFENWYYFKEYIPVINEISGETALYIENRLIKKIRNLDIMSDEKRELINMINSTSIKATERLMYGLKDNLEKDQWKECITGIYKSVVK